MAKDNESKTAIENYKSPVRKLVPFFKDSRDKWKAKCQEAKYQVKLLKNRIRHMEKRKVDLKHKIKVLEKELKRSQQKEQKLTDEVEALKKTTDEE